MGSGPPRARWARDSAYPYVFAVRARREIDGHSATEVCRFGVKGFHTRPHRVSLTAFSRPVAAERAIPETECFDDKLAVASVHSCGGQDAYANGNDAFG